MSLLDLLQAPWAIAPERLVQIQDLYAAHVRGEGADLAGIEARLGRPLANDQPRSYEVTQGVAVLPIAGVIAPKANLLTAVSGGFSADVGLQVLQQAAADPAVRSIVLYMDTPGGAVLGTPEYAAAVRSLSNSKPVVVLSDGQLASAGYWIASAANARYITGPTVQVGSIGVYQRHVDTSGAARARGEVVTEITSGTYKAIASSAAPLTAEGRALLQANSDYLYGLFVDTVAANLGTTADVVLGHMADGRVFFGQQAIDAGLVNGFSAMADLVAQLGADPGAFSKRTRARPKALMFVPPPQEPQMTDTSPQAATVTRETLERDHPALYTALREEFTTAGARAELARIQGVRATVLPGHEKLVEQLAFDGKTTPAEAALAINTAERQRVQAAAAAHVADAPPAAPADAGAGNAQPGAKTRQQMTDEAKAYAKDHGIEFLAAWHKLGFPA